MRDIMQIMGKRLVSDQQMIAYHRFPESDQITVIPPGQPSPLIEGYLPSGFFQVKGDRESRYILDSDHVRLVDPDAPDQSELFSRLESGLASFWINTENSLKSTGGYLSSGFSQAIDELRIKDFNLGKTINQAILLVAVVFSLWLIVQFKR